MTGNAVAPVPVPGVSPTVTVTVVVHSVHGSTRLLAEHLAAGARTVPGAQVHLVDLRPEDVVAGRWHDAEAEALLARSDAIVFGCPTLMGSVSAVFKAFMEAAFTPFTTQGWKDKLAGGFTMSASQSGDKLTVLQQLAVFGAQMGMQWIGVADMPGNNWSGGSRDDLNRLGSWLGLMAQSHTDLGPEDGCSPGDLITAERYGERVAALTQRWVNAVPYTTTRMTEHEARALSASLRERAAAPVA
ncbi:flavodoxin family protein [Streptomyces sp. NPDC004031]